MREVHRRSEPSAAACKWRAKAVTKLLCLVWNADAWRTRHATVWVALPLTTPALRACRHRVWGPGGSAPGPEMARGGLIPGSAECSQTGGGSRLKRPWQAWAGGGAASVQDFRSLAQTMGRGPPRGRNEPVVARSYRPHLQWPKRQGSGPGSARGAVGAHCLDSMGCICSHWGQHRRRGACWADNMTVGWAGMGPAARRLARAWYGTAGGCRPHLQCPEKAWSGSGRIRREALWERMA